jgi:hypothetical protein
VGRRRVFLAWYAHAPCVHTACAVGLFGFRHLHRDVGIGRCRSSAPWCDRNSAPMARLSLESALTHSRRALTEQEAPRYRTRHGFPTRGLRVGREASGRAAAATALMASCRRGKAADGERKNRLTRDLCDLPHSACGALAIGLRLGKWWLFGRSTLKRPPRRPKNLAMEAEWSCGRPSQPTACYNPAHARQAMERRIRRRRVYGELAKRELGTSAQRALSTRRSERSLALLIFVQAREGARGSALSAWRWPSRRWRPQRARPASIYAKLLETKAEREGREEAISAMVRARWRSSKPCAHNGQRYPSRPHPIGFLHYCRIERRGANECLERRSGSDRELGASDRFAHEFDLTGFLIGNKGV